MILSFSGRCRLFPGLHHLCCTSPFRVSSWQSTPLTPAVQTPKFETQHPAPTCRGYASCVLVGKSSLSVISVVNSLHFVFQTPTSMFSDEVLKLLPVPSHETFSKCMETFSFMTRAQVSVSKSFVSLSLFFLISIFSLLHSEEIGLPFGSLGSSARVQKVFCRICSTHKYTLDVFVGRKVNSLP